MDSLGPCVATVQVLCRQTDSRYSCHGEETDCRDPEGSRPGWGRVQETERMQGVPAGAPGERRVGWGAVPVSWGPEAVSCLPVLGPEVQIQGLQASLWSLEVWWQRTVPGCGWPAPVPASVCPNAPLHRDLAVTITSERLHSQMGSHSERWALGLQHIFWGRHSSTHYKWGHWREGGELSRQGRVRSCCRTIDVKETWVPTSPRHCISLPRWASCRRGQEGPGGAGDPQSSPGPAGK